MNCDPSVDTFPSIGNNNPYVPNCLNMQLHLDSRKILTWIWNMFDNKITDNISIFYTSQSNSLNKSNRWWFCLIQQWGMDDQPSFYIWLISYWIMGIILDRRSWKEQEKLNCMSWKSEQNLTCNLWKILQKGWIWLWAKVHRMRRKSNLKSNCCFPKYPAPLGIAIRTFVVISNADDYELLALAVFFSRKLESR